MAHTSPLTGSRIIDLADAPNGPQAFSNAVLDLEDNTIPRFSNASARDAAFSTWTAAGNSLVSGLTCFTQSDGRYWRYDTASSSWLYAGGNPPPIAVGNAGSGWNNGGITPGAYRDASGLVHLVGSVQPQASYNPQDGGTHTAFTLPAGYYPAKATYVMVLIPAAQSGFVTMLIPAGSGTVNVIGGNGPSIGANTGHYLDGIHYHPGYTSVPYL